MPYISDTQVTAENIPFPWCRDEVMVKVVREKLAAGQRVSIRLSSFSDPGRDWEELLADGRPIPGSYRQM